MSPYLCSERSLRRHHRGAVAYFAQEAVHPCCTQSLYYCLLHMLSSHQCERCVGPSSHTLLDTRQQVFYTRLLMEPSACRHPGSEGWLGLWVMHPPWAWYLKSPSLTCNRGCNQRVWSFACPPNVSLSCISTSHSSGIRTPPALLMEAAIYVIKSLSETLIFRGVGIQMTLCIKWVNRYA